MIANEMPEKIYLFDCNDAMVTPLEGNTVYVRKDAFIEKTEKYLQEHLIDYWSQSVTDESKFIDKFRNYMEGE